MLLTSVVEDGRHIALPVEQYQSNISLNTVSVFKLIVSAKRLVCKGLGKYSETLLSR